MKVDLLITDAEFLTQTHRPSPVRGCLIGSSRSMRWRLRPRRTVRADGVIVPGFNDAHAHSVCLVRAR